MSGSGPIYDYQREMTARLEQVMRERDEMLAVLCGDGGQYQQQNGIEAAVKHGLERFHEARARADESEHAMHLRIRAGYDKTVADSWRAKVAEVEKQRDEAMAELDFIKAEFGGADDESLTRDALLLKMRLLESELDGERASRRGYERSHDDILEALKQAEADAYHPEDGEPVALWGVQRLAKERDEARAEVERLKSAVESMRAARRLLAQLRDHVSDQACDELLSILSDEPLDADGNLYQTLVEAAYQCGAEAMREAAAGEVFAFYGWSKDNETTRGDIKNLAERLDALPIPKEEP